MQYLFYHKATNCHYISHGKNAKIAFNKLLTLPTTVNKDIKIGEFIVSTRKASFYNNNRKVGLHDKLIYNH